jgi:hypothetical protein
MLPAKSLTAALSAAFMLAAVFTFPVVGITPSDGTPARERITGPRLAAAGDISCTVNAPSGAICRAGSTGDLIRSAAPQQVITLGDNQYETGAYADFMSGYDKVWGSFRATTHPVPGNHEYRTTGAAGYYAYFGARSNEANDGTQRFGMRNGWTVIGLNTNCDHVDCGAEVAWLERQLGTSRACTIVYGHHPVYSSGQHGNTAWMAPFRRAMNAGAVDLYLAGHDHHYERFDKVNADTFRQFIIGTGGKSLYTIGAVETGSQVRSVRHGVGFFTLGRGTYAWRFRAINGAVVDAGSASCG